MWARDLATEESWWEMRLVSVTVCVQWLEAVGERGHNVAIHSQLEGPKPWGSLSSYI
jgi:hypothetical protein